MNGTGNILLPSNTYTAQGRGIHRWRTICAYVLQIALSDANTQFLVRLIHLFDLQPQAGDHPQPYALGNHDPSDNISM